MVYPTVSLMNRKANILVLDVKVVAIKVKRGKGKKKEGRLISKQFYPSFKNIKQSTLISELE